MPAAVTYIGVQLGGQIGAALIMNSVAVASALTYIAVATVTPAISRTQRRSTSRAHAGRRA